MNTVRGSDYFMTDSNHNGCFMFSVAQRETIAILLVLYKAKYIMVTPVVYRHTSGGLQSERRSIHMVWFGV